MLHRGLFLGPTVLVGFASSILHSSSTVARFGRSPAIRCSAGRYKLVQPRQPRALGLGVSHVSGGTVARPVPNRARGHQLLTSTRQRAQRQRAIVVGNHAVLRPMSRSFAGRRVQRHWESLASISVAVNRSPAQSSATSSTTAPHSLVTVLRRRRPRSLTNLYDHCPLRYQRDPRGVAGVQGSQGLRNAGSLLTARDAHLRRRCASRSRRRPQSTRADGFAGREARLLRRIRLRALTS